tara:strand:- start:44 stop:349 length:306 start_codon:yes stop_codon:yes gene_type:complete
MPKQKFGTPFKMKKSPVKYYEEIEAWKKYKKAKDLVSKKPAGFMERTVGRAAKTFARGAAGTIGAAAGLLYDFGKRSIERKKKGLSGFNIEKGKINKPFNF